MSGMDRHEHDYATPILDPTSAMSGACPPPAVDPALEGQPLWPTWTAPAGPPVRRGILTAVPDPADKAALAQQICDVMRMMYEHEFVVANDGNVSARLPNGNLLITASGVLKGYMTPDQVIETDPEGNSLDGRRVTTEVKMHVAAYQTRPDIRAVVHGHPIYAVAFSLAGVSLAECTIPEIIVTMGTIPTAPRSLPPAGSATPKPARRRTAPRPPASRGPPDRSPSSRRCCRARSAGRSRRRRPAPLAKGRLRPPPGRRDPSRRAGAHPGRRSPGRGSAGPRPSRCEW
jgi:hypothetical protein